VPQLITPVENWSSVSNFSTRSHSEDFTKADTLILGICFFMGVLKVIIKILRNKYLIASGIFLAWVLFFDSRDIFSQMEKKAELNSLLESKRFYEEEIKLARKQLADIQSNSAALEKVAREKYKMKKPNEDLFLVEEP